MKKQDSSFEKAVEEVLSIIQKRQLTFREYSEMKKILDEAISQRIIGNKKA